MLPGSSRSGEREEDLIALLLVNLIRVRSAILLVRTISNFDILRNKDNMPEFVVGTMKVSNKGVGIMANQGGSHEQHVKAGQSKSGSKQASSTKSSTAKSASSDNKSSGKQGGSHEQHVKAGQQSHKNSH